MATKTYELWHTYEIDGDPDDVRTVVTRNVDFGSGGANYIVLAKPNGAADMNIYPVEWDGDGEALLFPPTDLDDVDRDGNLYPYWINVRECNDVSERYPDEFPPNRI